MPLALPMIVFGNFRILGSDVLTMRFTTKQRVR
jgi:hypothetical protein